MATCSSRVDAGYVAALGAHIAASDPGARGSHMCPIVDLDGDGVEELMWGERCIELDGGRELFCADRDTYRGHSDIVQPVLDRETGRWFFYTCRESDPQTSPRVALFDDQGAARVGQPSTRGTSTWAGWPGWASARRDLVATAVRIGHKVCGPDGRYHTGMTSFCLMP